VGYWEEGETQDWDAKEEGEGIMVERTRRQCTFTHVDERELRRGFA
jgi:hypothetical protein